MVSDAPGVRLHKALAARQPLVYVVCQEEGRLEALLTRLAETHYGEARPLWSWSSTQGLTAAGQPARPCTEPLAALRHVLESGEDAFYLFKDLPAFWADDPALVRALRDLYATAGKRDLTLFISYPRLALPESLAHQMYMVDLGLPGEAEIRDYLAAVVTANHLDLPDAWVEQSAAAMKGMTLDQVRHLLLRLIAEHKLSADAALDEIHAEKASALMREGCLKYIPHAIDIDRVGGLENLKEWVTSRTRFFSRAGLEAGAPLPSGVLFMGVSGCGKSLAAKVIAGAWKLPLVRLDMNLVLSGAWGSPEYAFDHALRVAEQIAPLVLWIDEMENSFGYDEGSHGTNQNIFSSFLTWMQEKPATVFVVATANRIEKLPAEVIRKGRFDQLFFLDLPSDDERRAILAIHIEAAGGDPAAFNLAMLSAAMKNWSGAEIEQGVKAAVVHAFQEERPFNERDVLWSTGRLVPLARTMEEQIKQLRLWSQERATPASRKTGP